MSGYSGANLLSEILNDTAGLCEVPARQAIENCPWSERLVVSRGSAESHAATVRADPHSKMATLG